MSAKWPGKVDCYCTHQSGVNEVICICGAKQWNEAISQCTAVRDGVTEKEISERIGLISDVSTNQYERDRIATAIVKFLKQRMSNKGE